MSIEAEPNEVRTARVVGITATRYRIVQASDGTTVVSGPVTTGITNTGTQRYQARIAVPGSSGDYEIQWDDGSGSWSATEDLTVRVPGEDDVEYAFTLAHASPTFPAGTVVGAYAPPAWPVPSPGTVGPPGTATTTATVASDGSLAFTGLAPNTRYKAGAQVSGTWRYIDFRTS